MSCGALPPFRKTKQEKQYAVFGAIPRYFQLGKRFLALKSMKLQRSAYRV